ncbi:MAG: M61 family metallopeptidase [Gammaproteobacteria bacterium]|nr:M61 family metallopeptidase [Gammaproteobacteria bacterium]
MLHYTITPYNLGAHLIHVTIKIPAGEPIIIAKMPKWIPGSYKIRDYSRHLQSFSATAGDEALEWYKSDSDTWIVQADEKETTLNYQVYAYDLSVRGSYLDDTRMFFNHCCVALDIVHLSHEKRHIDIQSVDDWKVFTALDKQGNHYIADNYNHQIDCPVESAQKYLHSEFEAGGVRHEVIYTGTLSDDYDIQGMTDQLQKICQTEIDLFGGTPLDKYLFMNYIEPNQYGGLEHKNSVAQVASPEMMMKKGKPLTDKMIDFLGLCSHEYFHLWNVKRLQPRDFQPFDLYREQHTEMLWMFEGFTSYFDELFLLRAGIVNAETFLKRQATNLTRVLSVPGRLLQPLAASSFDAWTKLYQADSNSANHMVSYYSKGAVFALYLDLFLRKNSEGKSLEDVMRGLWSKFGAKGLGIDEDDVFEVCGRLLPNDKRSGLATLFVEGLHGTNDLPLDMLLPEFGIDYSASYAKIVGKTCTSDAGIRLKMNGSSATIAFLNSNSDAAKLGVSVDDEILAINGQTSQSIDFNHCLMLNNVGVELELMLSRRGRVFKKVICLKEPEKNLITFTKTSETLLGSSWLESRQ